ncbi:MAG: hypothetical protein ACTSPM_12505, partial [Candidatus Heimdallarchaeota archaeon]
AWNFQVDTKAPTITNVGNDPTTPTDADSVTFSCDVADLNGIDLVILHYRINGGVWSNVTMALDSGTTYQVTLGPFDYNDLFEYSIIAYDTAINPNAATNDNGGSYYSFTVVSGDVSAPTLSAIFNDPASPTDADTIAIRCNVTDTNDILSVTLHYRVNNTDWITVSMTQIADVTYEAEIGPFGYADLIEYYITAIDNSPNNNEATDDNGGEYYSFIITSSDVSGPIIDSVEHSPTEPNDGETISISCSVTDVSGVQGVNLLYRVIGSLWNNISMVLTTGDIYATDIGPFVFNALIEYYITAIDFSPINNSAINDNFGVNYNFIIGSSDDTAPTITYVTNTPDTPNATESIVISCTVGDTNGILAVGLYYRTDGSSWVSVSMSLDSGDTYIATIGAFMNNTLVEYYVFATDDSPNQNVAIDDNDGAYYSFTVITPAPPVTIPTSPTSLALLIPLVATILSTMMIRKKKKQ